MKLMLERVASVELKIIQAADAMREDHGTSPTFRAVLEELERKAERVSELLDESGDELQVQQALAELEEAGQIAKVAAEIEPRIEEDTRLAVRTACQAIDALAGTAARDQGPTDS